MAGFNLFDFSAPIVPQTASVPTSPKPSEDKDLKFLKELKNRGYTAEQAYQALQSVKQGKEPDFAVAEPKEDGGFFSSIESGVNYLGGGIGNVVGGFVEEVPRSVAGMATVASGLGSAIRSPFSPVEGYRQGVEDAGFVNRAAERVAGAVREYGAYEPDSTGAKIGEVGAQLASTVALPGGVMKTGAKGLELGARGAGQGVIEMGKFTAASEGRLPTGTEVAIGGTLGAAIPLAGQALASTGKALTRKFPIATVMNDLKMTPTERKTIEKITGKNAAEYVLGKNLGASSKEELAAYFDQQAVNAFKSVNEKLGKVNVRVKSAPAKEAIKDIVEQMESSPKLKRAYAEDISYLKTLLKQKDYSPVELNNLRRAFDKVNTGMFTTSGKMRSGLEADVDVRIREAISDEIEKAAKSAGFSVKEINNELRAGLTMKDAMLRSLSQEQKNNLVGLQDIGIMGVFSGGDPGTAIALGIAKRGLEGIRPGIAQKLYNMNKAPSAPLPANRGNTIPARLKSGLIPRTDTVPIVPAKVTKPLPLKKAGNAQNPTQSLKSNELPIKKGVNAPTVGEPTTPTRKGVSLSNIGKEKGGFLQIGKSTEPKPLTRVVDDGMESLRNEAKKYKSAEEFVRAQGEPVYHGTNAVFEKFDISKIGSKTDDGLWGRGFYFAPNKEMARIAPGGNGAKYVMEVFVDKEKLFDISKYKNIRKLADDLDIVEDNFTMGNDGIIRPKYSQVRQFTSHIEDLGFDGVYVNRGGKGDELVVFNPENIKTKSQLTDIYNQAHKPLPLKKAGNAIKSPTQSLKSKGGFVVLPNTGWKAGNNTKTFKVSHGTNVEFDEFDPKKINSVEAWGDWAGKGFYFTEDEGKALKYAEQAVKRKGGDAKVLKFEISMNKPYTINSMDDVKKLRDMFGGEDAYYELKDSNPQAIQDKLKSLGYDGVIDNLYGQKAVFDKSQIKRIK